MTLGKATPTSRSKSPLFSRRKRAATLLLETVKSPKGEYFKIASIHQARSKRLRGSLKELKARRQSEEAPEVLASWVSEVIDEGSGKILLKTPSGERHLSVQEISAEDDEVITEPKMHPDVAKAVDRARARGAETAAVILDQEDMLSGEAIGGMMGMSRQAVDKARKSGKLLAVEGSKRGFRYPLWQLDEHAVRRSGLLEVLDLVGNGWEAYRFFMALEDEIVNKDLLAQGEVEELLRRAKLWTSEDYT